MLQYHKDDSPISTQSFMGIVHKRRAVILFLFLLIVGIIVAATFLMPPIYRSTSRVMVDYQLEIEKEHLLHLVQVSDKSYFERLSSEPLLIKRRSILEPVVDALGLDSDKRSAKASPAQATSNREKAIEALAEKLKVEREKDSNILTVSYDSRNPRLATDIVRQVVAEYVKQRPELERDERAYQFFDQQIQEIKNQIDEIEKKGIDFRMRERLVSADKQSFFMFETIGEYDRRLSQIRAERIAKEARLKVLREHLAQGNEVIIPNTETGSSASRYMYVNELSRNLLSLELKKSDLEQRYTPQHPELAAVLAQIEKNKKAIRDEVQELIRGEELDIKAKYAEEQALAGSLAQVVNTVATLSRQEYELGKITIGLDDLKAVYSMLVRQREEARIAASRKEHMVKVKVIDEARLPQTPVYPNKPLWITLGILLGLVVSFGVAFFIEYFDRSLNTAADAEYCLGVPVIAAISDFKVKPVQPEAKGSGS